MIFANASDGEGVWTSKAPPGGGPPLKIDVRSLMPSQMA